MFENRDTFKEFLKNSNREVTIIKFTAKWCVPCKKINPIVKNLLQQYKDYNFRYHELDVDECTDTYSFFKKKRMVNGIPAFCVYYKSKYDEDTFYIPEKIVTGANPDSIINLFDEVLNNKL